MPPYFSREPGNAVMSCLEDPTTLLVGEVCAGDTIRLPLDLGGTTHTISSVKVSKCPKCAAAVRRYVLATANIIVFECSADGFLWCRA